MASKLVCAKDKILAHKTVYVSQGPKEQKVEKIQYYYTDKELIPVKNEVNRTSNSFTIQLGKGKFKARFYGWNKFHKINGKWYEVLKSNISPEDWAKEKI